ncbi:MAG: hypothetical protein FWD13_08000, partial [Treponema sp.]|nr:hypothetical protein [Treponema sp.]
MVERTKRPEYLPYLPQREYQDDLDVPSVIRNHNYNEDDRPLSDDDPANRRYSSVMEMAERY